MLRDTSALIMIAAFHLTTSTGGALAAPPLGSASAEQQQTLIEPVRNDRKPIRRIVAASQSAGEKCGVWRCTWPLSGGGCLVWEKTLCKIKTIDPFN